jgi:RHS repeat-associated protein
MPITDYYVASDAMGSVTAILDEDGNVLERRTYDAFGKMTCMAPDGTTVTESPTEVDVGFQGQIRDDMTGLYQMGYRWYNPALGRWLTLDPIGLNGGANLQTFAGNTPISESDPSGLSCKLTSATPTTKWTAHLTPEKTTLGSTSILEYVKVKWSRTFKVECECDWWCLPFTFKRSKEVVLKIERETEKINLPQNEGLPAVVDFGGLSNPVSTTFSSAGLSWLLGETLTTAAFSQLTNHQKAVILKKIEKTKPSDSVVPTDVDC